jgi:hypothetical protein
MNDARGAAQYIGRYLARPAIAEYRILKYDGKTVLFWYEDHQSGERVELELPVLEFMGRLIMHIPKKHFRMVRRYGLYRRDKNAEAKKVVSFWNYVRTKRIKKSREKVAKRLNWKERMIKEFGRNPIACSKCEKEMELWEIWHPKYGYIYDMSRDAPEVKEDEKRNGEGLGIRDPIRRRETGGILQLSLQAV